MIQTFIHSTENNNFYIYDDQSRLSMLIHPELQKAHMGEVDVCLYYSKKYAYLKEHGFFNKAKHPHFERLKEANVMESIIQTTQIVFEVTDVCNLKCEYCGYGDLYQVTDKRNHNKIDVDNAIKLLKYIFDLKIKSNKNKLMIGFYGGEPLLNIDFIKHIVKEVNQLNLKKNLDIEYSMTTNGTLINRNIDFLVSNKVHLVISIDGNETNHSYRSWAGSKRNSFKEVIKNINYIQQNHPIYFEKYVNFISVLHDRNSVKEIYKYIHTYYQKIPAIIELNTTDIKPNKKERFNKMFCSKRESENKYQNETISKIPATRYETSFFRELIEFVKYFNINHYISNKVSLFNHDEKFFPTGTCLPFSLKIFLTTQNKLLPCEKINFKYALGSIDKNIQLNIQEITKKYNNYFDHSIKICQDCYNYKFCGACVFHFDNLDKLETEDLICAYFQDQQSFGEGLRRKFSFFEQNPNDFFHILESVGDLNKDTTI